MSLIIAQGQDDMENNQKVMRISQGLMYLNALIWIVAGVAGFFLRRMNLNIPSWIFIGMAILMLGYGVILIGLGIGLGTRKKFFYYAVLVMIALSVILPIFDDFGFADLLAVIPAVITLVFLSINKKSFYWQQKKEK
jgi:lysylphosphatidylglycerol synthetase-like protein (DUF2156 family)